MIIIKNRHLIVIVGTHQIEGVRIFFPCTDIRLFLSFMKGIVSFPKVDKKSREL
jgi:hypothetical protein